MTGPCKTLFSLLALLSAAATHASAAEERTLAIDHVIVTVEGANDEWTPTPIELSPGDLLISFAKGSVKIGRSSTPTGPDGQRDGYGALQMKVGTTNVRTIGSRAIVQEPRGVVKLRILDTVFTDNEGTFQVELIKVPAAAVPPPRPIGDVRPRLDRGLAKDLFDVVDANPLDESAATALNNACVILEKTAATDEAAACRVRLNTEYPNGKPSSHLLTTAYVKREVSRSMAGIKSCYEQALRRDPKTAGQVTLGWTIVPDGSVRNIEVKVDTLHDFGMLNCMRATAAQWRFAPLSTGPLDVQFPFRFRAGAVN
jgi:hypothetical protein